MSFYICKKNHAFGDYPQKAQYRLKKLKLGALDQYFGSGIPKMSIWIQIQGGKH